MKLSLILAFWSSLSLAGSYIHDCSRGELVAHTFYTLCYAEEHEQAFWTEHTLNRAQITGTQRRTNNFKYDPKISTQSAGPRDYRGSGYDRGHLVPAGDMKVNYTSMSESFFMSNMSPQTPGFNRGIWRVLEERIRSWFEGDDLIIITGPVLKSGLSKLNEISIPEEYYKILFHPSKSRMIAFLMKNESSRQPLENFVVSVDYLEQLTELDFFSSLPVADQEILEASSDYNEWESEL